MYFAATNSSGGSYTPFLIVVAFGLVIYFIVLRPMRRRQQQAQAAQREMRTNLGAGTKVVTIGGLYGTVVSTDDESVTLEISPGVTARYDRNAIGRVLETPDAPDTAGGPDGYGDGVVDGADLDDLHSAEADADPAGDAHSGSDGHRGDSPNGQSPIDEQGKSPRSVIDKND